MYKRKGAQWAPFLLVQIQPMGGFDIEMVLVGCIELAGVNWIVTA